MHWIVSSGYDEPVKWSFSKAFPAEFIASEHCPRDDHPLMYISEERCSTSSLDTEFQSITLSGKRLRQATQLAERIQSQSQTVKNWPFKKSRNSSYSAVFLWPMESSGKPGEREQRDECVHLTNKARRHFEWQNFPLQKRLNVSNWKCAEPFGRKRGSPH